MQFILLQEYYALKHENEDLKEEIESLKKEIESLKEKITASKKIDESHADELVKQLKFNIKK
jgi:cell division septum initiation protein DivIVA